METGKMEMNQEQAEQVSGGAYQKTRDTKYDGNCRHPRKYKTGRDREDSRWIVCSQHQYEYYCPDCRKTFWVDEER